jgi:hypothetical protein
MVVSRHSPELADRAKSQIRPLLLIKISWSSASATRRAQLGTRRG